MKGFLLFIGCIVIGFMTSSVKFALLLIVILIIMSIVKACKSDKPAPTKLTRRNNQFYGEKSLFHEDKFDPLHHFDPDSGIF
ncbi:MULTISPECIES: hypothetical protein [unclassified Shewanella]|uniref:hypothetical protein n=1 Tax=Shewanella TaxID=22 RepID=UPI0021D9792F|nr:MULTISPECIES: hypothetical protein [unclassified Shewanella]MCU7962074.1 hypothetical protein [Shewanella sp. SW32]MCU7970006.1 hypothetical protein [Shewanella sp. SW29]MCU8013819.1 hypothetical protein [Shewanella sp. SM74]MCU8056202.1 hypothetical protein [Shewanella sp. SM35]MCU8065136.1 hypothetical protein [Shewanella sp. SM34]